jgi:hypothetical protein
MIKNILEVSITRYHRSTTETIGQLEIKGDKPFTLATIERPWLDNAPNVSCIPVGVYKARRYFSPSRHEDCWMLEDVPGRTYIQIHTANYPRHVEGCIGVGLSPMDDMNGVISSAVARHRLEMRTLRADQLNITITEV